MHNEEPPQLPMKSRAAADGAVGEEETLSHAGEAQAYVRTNAGNMHLK